MRGVYTAAYLDALEQSFAQKRGVAHLDVGKAFGLITGTSTGAIIGCGLAMGLSPFQMRDLYVTRGAKVFPRKMPSRLGFDLVKQLLGRPRHLARGDQALTEALVAVLGGTTLREIWERRGIALAIPAVNMSNFRGWVFKTPHDRMSNRRDDDYTLVDVCRASSAAPLYRSLAAIDDPRGNGYDVFADGGLWANNPVIVGLVEALRMLEGSSEDIEIFCLGSCGKPEGQIIPRTGVHRGLAPWKFGGEAANVSIAAQEFVFDMIARMLAPHLKRSVQVVRFPSNKVPGAMLKYLDLDETRPEGLDVLKRQARHDADMTNSGIQQGTAEGLAIEALFNAMPPKAE